jgi:ankyrin repeat protein
MFRSAKSVFCNLHVFLIKKKIILNITFLFYEVESIMLLWDAIRSGKLVQVWQLLDYIPAINFKFRKAYGSGQLKLAKQLVDTVTREHLYTVLRSACQNGDLYIANFILEIAPKLLKNVENFEFQHACASGKLDVAKWLLKRLDSVPFGDAFRLSCSFGHLNIAKWLVRQFPRINIDEYEHSAIRYACANGHIKVAKWLYSKSQVLSDTAHNFAYCWALENKRTGVSKWLLRIVPHTSCARHVQIASFFFKYK